VRVFAAKSTLIRRRVAVLTGSVLEETWCDSRMCFSACLEADETTLSEPPEGCDWVVTKGACLAGTRGVSGSSDGFDVFSCFFDDLPVFDYHF
jgi:hypothetical protein